VTAVRAGAGEYEGLVEQLQASLLFLHEPVSDRAEAALVVDLDTPVVQLAQQMTQAGAAAALVSSGSGAIIGIVTDRDVRARVVAEERTVDKPVRAVMSAPLIRISHSAAVYEALMRMDEHEVSHLAIEAPDGTVTGVIDRDALIGNPQYSPLALLREIVLAESPKEVARKAERRLPLAAGLVGCSARPRPVTGMLSSVFDAATVRLVELAIDELGPPPVGFAFIALGSQGRREVQLTSDQDNGIVYAAASDADADGARGYFLGLGARVCEGLNAAGYPLCRGRVMANDPKWCRSLPDWLSRYDAWLRKAERQDITDLSIFLDFRSVYGDAELVHQLRRHVHATLPDQRGVQYQLVRNALAFRPPIRLPGNIYVGGASEHSGHIDLKDALQPLVAYARVEAARHRIGQTHTLGRIVELADRGHLSPTSRDEITDAYDFLMQLRLETQLADVRAGDSPASSVEISQLSHIQRELLRTAFSQIAAIQKTAENEFPESGQM